MLKKIIKYFLYKALGKKMHYKYSSSDYKHYKGGHHGHHYGHNHYKKKKYTSHSFFSS